MNYESILRVIGYKRWESIKKDRVVLERGHIDCVLISHDHYILIKVWECEEVCFTILRQLNFILSYSRPTCMPSIESEKSLVLLHVHKKMNYCISCWHHQSSPYVFRFIILYSILVTYEGIVGITDNKLYNLRRARSCYIKEVRV